MAFLATGRVGVRDSKNPQGPALVFGAAEWRSCTAAIENGALEG
ncbi:regulator [Nocardia seriolae]|nr:regulator [Nocardia seriolae]